MNRPWNPICIENKLKQIDLLIRLLKWNWRNNEGERNKNLPLEREGMIKIAAKNKQQLVEATLYRYRKSEKFVKVPALQIDTSTNYFRQRSAGVPSQKRSFAIHSELEERSQAYQNE
jgi:hypothetical protein